MMREFRFWEKEMQSHFVSRIRVLYKLISPKVKFSSRFTWYPELLTSVLHVNLCSLSCRVSSRAWQRGQSDPFSGWGGVDGASGVWAGVVAAPPVAWSIRGRVRVVPLARGGQCPAVSLWPSSWMAVTGSGSTLTAPWWIRTMVVPGIFSRPGEHKTHLDNHLFLVSMGSLVLFEGKTIIQTWTMRNTLSLSTDYVKYIYLALFTIHIFFKTSLKKMIMLTCITS